MGWRASSRELSVPLGPPHGTVIYVGNPAQEDLIPGSTPSLLLLGLLTQQPALRHRTWQASTNVTAAPRCAWPTDTACGLGQAGSSLFILSPFCLRFRSVQRVDWKWNCGITLLRAPLPSFKNGSCHSPCTWFSGDRCVLGELMTNLQHHSFSPSPVLMTSHFFFCIVFLLEFPGKGEGTVWVTGESSRAIYLSGPWQALKVTVALVSSPASLFQYWGLNSQFWGKMENCS